MVEFIDGSILAQLGPPDMRVPIRYALGFPGRIPSGNEPVDIQALSGLTFEEPDREAFPCLALGERVAREGGLSGTIFNAANEVAVDAFLAGQVGFLAIADIVADALASFDNRPEPDLATILSTDQAVREHARQRLLQHTS
jgi:1-deoxy-D-xylulose-5-phosphate reductoisomerase